MGHIINAEPPLGVHECYRVKDVFFVPALRATHEIDMWAYFPEFESDTYNITEDEA